MGAGGSCPVHCRIFSSIHQIIKALLPCPPTHPQSWLSKLSPHFARCPGEKMDHTSGVTPLRTTALAYPGLPLETFSYRLAVAQGSCYTLHLLPVMILGCYQVSGYSVPNSHFRFFFCGVLLAQRSGSQGARS